MNVVLINLIKTNLSYIRAYLKQVEGLNLITKRETLAIINLITKIETLTTIKLIAKTKLLTTIKMLTKTKITTNLLTIANKY